MELLYKNFKKKQVLFKTFNFKIRGRAKGVVPQGNFSFFYRKNSPFDSPSRPPSSSLPLHHQNAFRENVEKSKTFHDFYGIRINMMFNIVGDARTNVRPSRRSPNKMKSQTVYEILVVEIYNQKIIWKSQTVSSTNRNGRASRCSCRPYKLLFPWFTGLVSLRSCRPYKRAGFATLLPPLQIVDPMGHGTV